MDSSSWFEIAKPKPSLDPVQVPSYRRRKSVVVRLCSFLCCLSVALWIILPFVLGITLAFDGFLKAHSRAKEYMEETPVSLPEYQYWPGCAVGGKSAKDFERCAQPCFGPELILAMSTFNKEHTYQKVSYPSRQDQDGRVYTLSGWWLPAGSENLPAGTPAPRVVIQHGFRSNSNDWTLTLAAYYMRSLGFSVLLNNLRNHGYSSNAIHNFTTWGYEYHYDLLGAWDYLRGDPDSIMGGALPSANVGIMGFSMGAFVAINALTMEKQIPAAWLESPPASPKSVFLETASRTTPIVFDIPGFGSMIWFWMTARAGVDIEAHTPLKNIPTGPKGKRPLQIVHNRLDELVTQSEVQEVVDFFLKYPDKYHVKELFYVSGLCNGHHHVVTGLLEPIMYKRRLCDFWTGALNVPRSICGLDGTEQREFPHEKLPHLLNATRIVV